MAGGGEETGLHRVGAFSFRLGCIEMRCCRPQFGFHLAPFSHIPDGANHVTGSSGPHWTETDLNREFRAIFLLRVKVEPRPHRTRRRCRKIGAKQRRVDLVKARRHQCFDPRAYEFTGLVTKDGLYLRRSEKDGSRPVDDECRVRRTHKNGIQPLICIKHSVMYHTQEAAWKDRKALVPLLHLSPVRPDELRGQHRRRLPPTAAKRANTRAGNTGFHARTIGLRRCPLMRRARNSYHSVHCPRRCTWLAGGVERSYGRSSGRFSCPTAPIRPRHSPSLSRESRGSALRWLP